ncbi:conserved hypothetical protein [Candidatus Desulfarcum epimagneticum]|uniref:GDT1 family protein n=1 Tax=uncultured Desulfobacteraceae bacterium TaxID=218296 RepID=A0A484HE28_9BACT|nr:conserved hypothetical protein [uncultured Desulfobacteraceae bacterium]
MDYKIFFTVFFSIFVAELGDKTQIATLLFASDKNISRGAVFLAASLALVAASAMAAWAGGIISQHVGEKTLVYIAGGGFIVIGVWTLIRAQPVIFVSPPATARAGERESRCLRSQGRF